MDNYIVIKNGLVHTLDGKGSCGKYNILIKNGKIISVDQTDKLTEEHIASNYPDAEIINANDKIILPGFINASFNSSYLLSGVFFKRNLYDNIHSNISLNLIDRYFASSENRNDLEVLLETSYLKALLNGETSLAEFSTYILKDFYNGFIENNEYIKQGIIFTSWEDKLSGYLNEKKIPHLFGFKIEDEVNTYSINAVKKHLSGPYTKVCLDLLSSHKIAEQVKNSFGKSVVKLLSQYGLLSSDVILTNPIYVDEEDINILKEGGANIVFNVTDYRKLSKKNIDFEVFLKSGVNISIGTGYLGRNIFSELKSLSELVYHFGVSYDMLMEMITKNPTNALGTSDVNGSIANNKDASLVMFDLSDFRNLMSIPDMDCEKLSEFVIENLSVGDISDVFVNGEHVVSDYKATFPIDENARGRIDGLKEKIFEVGNYFQFKEKYLMRKRVNDISLSENAGEVSTEGMVDNKDPEYYRAEEVEEKADGIEGDGEFKVVGVKKDDLFGSGEELSDNREKELFTITEITTFNNGLKIYSEKDYSSSRENKKDEFVKQDYVKEGAAKNSGASFENQKEESPKVKLKKSKLKFGFSGDD